MTPAAHARRARRRTASARSIVTSADVTGRLVGKRFSPDVFRRLIHEGVPPSSCVLGWDLDQWPGPAQAYTGHHTGWHDVRLVPDLGDAAAGGVARPTAICVADFVEMGGRARRGRAPHDPSPPGRAARPTTGLTPQVASELEFSLYRGTYDEGRTNGYESLTTDDARARRLHRAGGRSHEAFFAEVREALTRSDLGPWTSQAEWGLGQWEINLEHRHALEMADRHVAVQARDARHGGRPRDGGRRSWPSPSPTRPAPRAICTCRWSMRDRRGERVPRTPNGAPTGSSATAAGGGRAASLGAARPELMLLYAPTVNSYRRTHERRVLGQRPSAGASTAGWSPAACSPRSADSTRLEWRMPGADVNPYLAIAALLASARRRHGRRRRPGRAARSVRTSSARCRRSRPPRRGRRRFPRRARSGTRRLRRGRRGPLRGGRPVGVGAVPRARRRHRVGASPVLRVHLTSAATIPLPPSDLTLDPTLDPVVGFMRGDAAEGGDPETPRGLRRVLP